MLLLLAVAHAEDAPLPDAHPGHPPFSFAFTVGVPFAGSDAIIRDELEHFLRFGYGIGARGELGWGRPELRAAIVASVTESTFPNRDGSTYSDVRPGITAQANPRLRDGDWEVRMPVEVGVSWGFVAPILLTGLALRVQASGGIVRPLAELRLLAALGGTMNPECLGCGAPATTDSGWSLALNVGLEVGYPYSRAPEPVGPQEEPCCSP